MSDRNNFNRQVLIMVMLIYTKYMRKIFQIMVMLIYTMVMLIYGHVDLY